jgi:two-component system, LuxR family, response regulator DctR
MSQVFVVDDDAGVRQALGWLLRSRQLSCELFDSAEAFLEFLEDVRYPTDEDVVLILDVRMQGMSGLELYETLNARGMTARMPVIFLTGHADVPTAVAYVKKGALDFFEKPFNDNTLIDRVVEGLQLSLAQMSVTTSLADISKRLEGLTERERSVMQLIMHGRLNKVIADELGISMRTVEVHRSRIFAKLKVRSAVEMVNLLNKK